MAFLILEPAVGSQKSTQALGAPRTIKKCLITNKVTTNFLIAPCTPIPYVSFLRPTAGSRIIIPSRFLYIRSPSKIRLISDKCAGFGQIFRSFSFNSSTIRLKRSKHLTPTSPSSPRSLISDRLLTSSRPSRAETLKTIHTELPTQANHTHFVGLTKPHQS